MRLIVDNVLPVVVIMVVALCHTACALGNEATQEQARPHVVFVIGEREFDTRTTLPAFARAQLESRGWRCTFVHAASDGDDAARNNFPGIEAVAEADLLVLSVRRRTLRAEQFRFIREYLDAGKPLVALRTTSHGFSLARGDAPRGHRDWPTFDRDVLGGRYDFYHRADPGTTRVQANPDASEHPILNDVDQSAFMSRWHLYIHRDLAEETTVLMHGWVDADRNNTTEPVAWTHTYNDGRVFYTSLGGREDFDLPPFRRMLLNAMHWALELDIPTAAEE